jgi:outer membrane receptor protein involved in Fe transport
MSNVVPAARAAAACLLLSACAVTARAADPDTVFMQHPPGKYGIVVSATKTSKAALDIPNGTAVVSGADLRARGAHTLGEALVDVVGFESGGGSDNGSRLPNVGMWGLKEFDAMLITLDGVPVGGPFVPALSQISVDDIDRIEIVKGPQGTLYGMSAFAGMVQVFTDRDAPAAPRSITLGGGSFGNGNGRLGIHQALNDDWAIDVAGSGMSEDGWQDRTHSRVARGRVSISGKLGGARHWFDLSGLSDKQDWGTPVPVDAGEVVPGFDRKHNYAVGGAVVEHNVFALTHCFSTPAFEHTSFENTAGLTHDRGNSIRNFFADFPDPDTVGSAGVAIQPRETDFFDDARFISRFSLSGQHELVTGAAITWGRTKAAGIGFDFDQSISNSASIPDWQDIPVGDHRHYEDRRTFVGVYAHDSWTPVSLFTLSGGGRWDQANEKLHAFGQEEGAPEPDVADDARTDKSWSGDLGLVVRLISGEGRAGVGALNAYGNWKSSFKPAAPNLNEAEGAHILDPERTHSMEGGLKGAAFGDQLMFAASIFEMDFHNMVVSVVSASGEPELVNAGHERFKGYEVEATIAPKALKGLTLSGGYAHHDPRFVKFSFFADPTDITSLRVVDGKLLELAPQEMYNARAGFAPSKAFSVWGALRHQGTRALNRRNGFWADAFDEIDAGANLSHKGTTLAVAGRNLGDTEFIVSESEIGDSQFYFAPPKRFTASLSFAF